MQYFVGVPLSNCLAVVRVDRRCCDIIGLSKLKYCIITGKGFQAYMGSIKLMIQILFIDRLYAMLHNKSSNVCIGVIEVTTPERYIS